MLFGRILNPLHPSRRILVRGLKTIRIGGSALARFRCSRLCYESGVRPLNAVCGKKAANSLRCSEMGSCYLLEDERCFALPT